MDIVCFRNICINTLHKGDNDDDNDDDDDNNNNIFNCKWAVCLPVAVVIIKLK
jgi:hypothetical protein